jgi:hypothetical protein
MLKKKYIVALAAGCFSPALAHAADRPALPRVGHFFGYGTVASITSTLGDTCGVSQGDAFTGVLQLPGPDGKGSIFRLPVTLPSGMVVQEDVFPETFKADVVTSGYFQLGIEGAGALETGTYQADFHPLDAQSFTGTLTMTYQNPTGAPGDSCTETDWLVFVRTSGPVSDDRNSN